MPVIVGGGGPKRTPALAARYAAEFNIDFVDETTIAEKFAGVRSAAEEIGRDADDLIYSVALPTAIGADADEYARRARAVGGDRDEYRIVNIAGSSAEAVDRIGRLAELGTDRLYLQVMDLRDLDHLELLAAEVLPHFR